MANLNDLPFEMKMMLIHYLDVNAMLKLRQVNKKFKNIVESQSINSLCVNFWEPEKKYFAGCGLKIDGKFFLTNVPFNKCSHLKSKNSDLFKSEIMKSLLCKIKKLFIDRVPASGYKVFNLNHINHFQSLEQLQIDNLRIRENSTLRLKCLKILHIEKIETRIWKLLIDCPLLFAFKCDTSILNGDFEFKNQSTITHIDLGIPTNRNDLVGFINLKYISYKNDYRSMDDKDYSIFPHLKEVNYDFCHLENLKILFEKKRADNLNFKIYLRDMCIESEEDIYSYTGHRTYGSSEFMDTEMICLMDTEMICLNYSKTKPQMNFCTNIDYTSLISVLGNVPENFFDKFTNILIVKVSNNEGTNQEQFVDFIKKVKDLRILDLDVSFDQHFYDNLFINCPFLNKLNVNETKSIDVDFLFALKNLKMFKINQIVSFDKIGNAFDTLPLFSDLDFLFDGRQMLIGRRYDKQKESYEMLIRTGKNTFAYFDSPKSLVRMIKFLMIKNYD